MVPLSRTSSKGRVETELSSGEAVVDGADEPGRIVVEEPESLTGDLPVGAVFPMQFTIDVLERAATGERFMNHVVFDGMDGAVASEYTTFVQSAGEKRWPQDLDHEGLGLHGPGAYRSGNGGHGQQFVTMA